MHGDSHVITECLLVNLVSHREGHWQAIQVARRIYEAEVEEPLRQMPSKRQDLELVHRVFEQCKIIDEFDRGFTQLSVLGNEFPEIQLLVSCSSYLNLEGVPPWDIRLAEIHHFPTWCPEEAQICHLLDRSLLKYSRCEQRFGA